MEALTEPFLQGHHHSASTTTHAPEAKSFGGQACDVSERRPQRIQMIFLFSTSYDVEDSGYNQLFTSSKTAQTSAEPVSSVSFNNLGYLPGRSGLEMEDLDYLLNVIQ